MMKSLRWLGVLIIGVGGLVTYALADHYFDSVGTDQGTYFSSSTVYNVPAGALVEYGAFGNPPDADAGTWITGGGLDIYQYVDPTTGGEFDEYTYTTEAGDIGYQIWARSGGGYVSAYISVSW